MFLRIKIFIVVMFIAESVTTGSITEYFPEISTTESDLILYQKGKESYLIKTQLLIEFEKWNQYKRRNFKMLK